MKRQMGRYKDITDSARERGDTNSEHTYDIEDTQRQRQRDSDTDGMIEIEDNEMNERLEAQNQGSTAHDQLNTAGPILSPGEIVASSGIPISFDQMSVITAETSRNCMEKPRALVQMKTENNIHEDRFAAPMQSRMEETYNDTKQSQNDITQTHNTTTQTQKTTTQMNPLATVKHMETSTTGRMHNTTQKQTDSLATTTTPSMTNTSTVVTPSDTPKQQEQTSKKAPAIARRIAAIESAMGVKKPIFNAQKPAEKDVSPQGAQVNRRKSQSNTIDTKTQVIHQKESQSTMSQPFNVVTEQTDTNIPSTSTSRGINEPVEMTDRPVVNAIKPTVLKPKPIAITKRPTLPMHVSPTLKPSVNAQSNVGSSNILVKTENKEKKVEIATKTPEQFEQSVEKPTEFKVEKAIKSSRQETPGDGNQPNIQSRQTTASTTAQTSILLPETPLRNTTTALNPTLLAETTVKCKTRPITSSKPTTPGHEEPIRAGENTIVMMDGREQSIIAQEKHNAPELNRNRNTNAPLDRKRNINVMFSDSERQRCIDTCERNRNDDDDDVDRNRNDDNGDTDRNDDGNGDRKRNDDDSDRNRNDDTDITRSRNDDADITRNRNDESDIFKNRNDGTNVFTNTNTVPDFNRNMVPEFTRDSVEFVPHVQQLPQDVVRADITRETIEKNEQVEKTEQTEQDDKSQHMTSLMRNQQMDKSTNEQEVKNEQNEQNESNEQNEPSVQPRTECVMAVYCGTQRAAITGLKVGENTGENTGEAVEENMKKAVGENMGETVGVNIRDTVGDTMKEIVVDTMAETVGDISKQNRLCKLQEKAHIREAVADREYMGDAVGDTLKETVGESSKQYRVGELQVGDQTRDVVDGNTVESQNRESHQPVIYVGKGSITAESNFVKNSESPPRGVDNILESQANDLTAHKTSTFTTNKMAEHFDLTTTADDFVVGLREDDLTVHNMSTSSIKAMGDSCELPHANDNVGSQPNDLPTQNTTLSSRGTKCDNCAIPRRNDDGDVLGSQANDLNTHNMSTTLRIEMQESASGEFLRADDNSYVVGSLANDKTVPKTTSSTISMGDNHEILREDEEFEHGSQATQATHLNIQETSKDITLCAELETEGNMETLEREMLTLAQELKHLEGAVREGTILDSGVIKPGEISQNVMASDGSNYLVGSEKNDLSGRGMNTGEISQNVMASDGSNNLVGSQKNDLSGRGMNTGEKSQNVIEFGGGNKYGDYTEAVREGTILDGGDIKPGVISQRVIEVGTDKRRERDDYEKNSLQERDMTTGELCETAMEFEILESRVYGDKGALGMIAKEEDILQGGDMSTDEIFENAMQFGFPKSSTCERGDDSTDDNQTPDITYIEHDRGNENEANISKANHTREITDIEVRHDNETDVNIREEDQSQIEQYQGNVNDANIIKEDQTHDRTDTKQYQKTDNDVKITEQESNSLTTQETGANRQGQTLLRKIVKTPEVVTDAHAPKGIILDQQNFTSELRKRSLNDNASDIETNPAATILHQQRSLDDNASDIETSPPATILDQQRSLDDNASIKTSPAATNLDKQCSPSMRKYIESGDKTLDDNASDIKTSPPATTNLDQQCSQTIINLDQQSSQSIVGRLIESEDKIVLLNVNVSNVLNVTKAGDTDTNTDTCIRPNVTNARDTDISGQPVAMIINQEQAIDGELVEEECQTLNESSLTLMADEFHSGGYEELHSGGMDGISDGRMDISDGRLDREDKRKTNLCDGKQETSNLCAEKRDRSQNVITRPNANTPYDATDGRFRLDMKINQNNATNRTLDSPCTTRRRQNSKDRMKITKSWTPTRERKTYANDDYQRTTSRDHSTDNAQANVQNVSTKRDDQRRKSHGLSTDHSKPTICKTNDQTVSTKTYTYDEYQHTKSRDHRTDYSKHTASKTNVQNVSSKRDDQRRQFREHSTDNSPAITRKTNDQNQKGSKNLQANSQEVVCKPRQKTASTKRSGFAMIKQLSLEASPTVFESEFTALESKETRDNQCQGNRADQKKTPLLNAYEKNELSCEKPPRSKLRLLRSGRPKSLDSGIDLAQFELDLIHRLMAEHSRILYGPKQFKPTRKDSKQTEKKSGAGDGKSNVVKTAGNSKSHDYDVRPRDPKVSMATAEKLINTNTQTKTSSGPRGVLHDHDDEHNKSLCHEIPRDEHGGKASETDDEQRKREQVIYPPSVPPTWITAKSPPILTSLQFASKPPVPKYTTKSTPCPRNTAISTSTTSTTLLDSQSQMKLEETLQLHIRKGPIFSDLETQDSFKKDLDRRTMLRPKSASGSYAKSTDPPSDGGPVRFNERERGNSEGPVRFERERYRRPRNHLLDEASRAEKRLQRARKKEPLDPDKDVDFDELEEIFEQELERLQSCEVEDCLHKKDDSPTLPRKVFSSPLSHFGALCQGVDLDLDDITAKNISHNCDSETLDGLNDIRSDLQETRLMLERMLKRDTESTPTSRVSDPEVRHVNNPTRGGGGDTHLHMSDSGYYGSKEDSTRVDWRNVKESDIW